MTDTERAAAEMDDLSATHKVSEAKREMDALFMAAGLIAEFEPKNAATLYRKGAKAATTWSKLADPSSSSTSDEED